jgi:hypothetical protein
LALAFGERRHSREVGVTIVMGAVLCVLAGTVAAAVVVLPLIPTVRVAVAARASADGTVVGHDRSDTQEATWYYPRAVFTAEGREWVVRGLLGHHRPRPRLGSRARVYFPPDAPQAAELGRAGGGWLALAVLAVGIALVLIAVWKRACFAA